MGPQPGTTLKKHRPNQSSSAAVSGVVPSGVETGTASEGVGCAGVMTVTGSGVLGAGAGEVLRPQAHRPASIISPSRIAQSLFMAAPFFRMHIGLLYDFIIPNFLDRFITK